MTAAEIETLRAAARRDDPIAVMDAIDRVHASYERDRIGYRRFDTMASLLSQTVDEGDDAARNYRETVIELEQRRIELDRTALAYVQGENPAETLVASVDAVDEAYRRCERRIETLETTVSDVSVPPLLIVSGNPGVEVPKGTTVSRELTLFNVGRSHTGSIAVDAESEVRTSATPSSLASLDEGGSEPLHVSLSPAIAGEFDVFVTATGEAAADRFRFTVLVLAQGEYVERASRIAESLEATLDSASPGRGRKSGLRNQARTLRRRLESISADLEGQRPPNRSIDTQLNAARNVVDAMERRVILLEPSVERQELLYTLESIGDRTDDAIEALP